MMRLIGVDGSEQPRGVEKDHRSPKPASASSTLMARSGCPL
jgi:hypothetical protein